MLIEIDWEIFHTKTKIFIQRTPVFVFTMSNRATGKRNKPVRAPSPDKKRSKPASPELYPSDEEEGQPPEYEPNLEHYLQEHPDESKAETSEEEESDVSFVEGTPQSAEEEEEEEEDEEAPTGNESANFFRLLPKSNLDRPWFLRPLLVKAVLGRMCAAVYEWSKHYFFVAYDDYSQAYKDLLVKHWLLALEAQPLMLQDTAVFATLVTPLIRQIASLKPRNIDPENRPIMHGETEDNYMQHLLDLSVWNTYHRVHAVALEISIQHYENDVASAQANIILGYTKPILEWIKHCDESGIPDGKQSQYNKAKVMIHELNSVIDRQFSEQLLGKIGNYLFRGNIQKARAAFAHLRIDPGLSARMIADALNTLKTQTSVTITFDQPIQINEKWIKLLKQAINAPNEMDIRRPLKYSVKEGKTERKDRTAYVNILPVHLGIGKEDTKDLWLSHHKDGALADYPELHDHAVAMKKTSTDTIVGSLMNEPVEVYRQYVLPEHVNDWPLDMNHARPLSLTEILAWLNDSNPVRNTEWQNYNTEMVQAGEATTEDEKEDRLMRNIIVVDGQEIKGAIAPPAIDFPVAMPLRTFNGIDDAIAAETLPFVHRRWLSAKDKFYHEIVINMNEAPHYAAINYLRANHEQPLFYHRRQYFVTVNSNRSTSGDDAEAAHDGGSIVTAMQEFFQILRMHWLKFGLNGQEEVKLRNMRNWRILHIASETAPSNSKLHVHFLLAFSYITFSETAPRMFLDYDFMYHDLIRRFPGYYFHAQVVKKLFDEDALDYTRIHSYINKNYAELGKIDETLPNAYQGALQPGETYRSRMPKRARLNQAQRKSNKRKTS